MRNCAASGVYCGCGSEITTGGMNAGSLFLIATATGAAPMLLVKPAELAVPVPPGLPVPPTTPLAKPAEATLPMSFPPGTPLATPAPNEVPETAPLRAAPAPEFSPGARAKLPMAATADLVLGFVLAPCGSPKPPVFNSGLVWLFATWVGLGLSNMPVLGCGGGATALGGAGGSLGCSGVSSFTGLG